MPLRLIERPSPNQDARPAGAPIDMLVLHYTGMKTAEEALARLTDAQARVSAHYTIDRDGTVYAHVPEEQRAWHAGVSYWAGETNVNARSIGIELVNPGHEFGYIPFAEQQIAALIDLSEGIFKRYAIPPARVVAHSDIAPARKEDPGELFPWKQVAEFSIGIWPNSAGQGLSRRSSKGAKVDGENNLTANLSRFGYGVPPHADVPLEKVIAAFQRHFRPSCIDGIADAECAALLESLLAA